MPKVLSRDDIEAFRAELCDAAEELFAAHGPDGVTMRELADAVGVSAMTPYRYFESKDALLAAVRARAFSRFADAIGAFDAKAAKRSPIDPRAMTRAFFRARTDAYIDFALDNPAAYRLMFDVNQPTAQSYPELAAAIARTKALMAPRGGGGARAQAPSPASYTLWSAGHGALMLSLAGMLPATISVRDLVHASVTAIAEQLGFLR